MKWRSEFLLPVLFWDLTEVTHEECLTTASGSVQLVKNKDWSHSGVLVCVFVCVGGVLVSIWGVGNFFFLLVHVELPSEADCQSSVSTGFYDQPRAQKLAGMCKSVRLWGRQGVPWSRMVMQWGSLHSLFVPFKEPIKKKEKPKIHCLNLHFADPRSGRKEVAWNKGFVIFSSCFMNTKAVIFSVPPSASHPSPTDA